MREEISGGSSKLGWCNGNEHARGHVNSRRDEGQQHPRDLDSSQPRRGEAGLRQSLMRIPQHSSKKDATATHALCPTAGDKADLRAEGSGPSEESCRGCPRWW